LGHKSRFVEGRRAIACEQEFWFGISRFMRKTPSQRVSLAGPQHDVIVKVTLFDTHGQRGGTFAVYFSLVVADKFNWISSFIDERTW